MAVWSVLILIVFVIGVYLVLRKIYVENKIKNGRHNLAGKVKDFNLWLDRFNNNNNNINKRGKKKKRVK